MFKNSRSAWMRQPRQPQTLNLGVQLQPHGVNQSERIASRHRTRLNAVVEPDLAVVEKIFGRAHRRADEREDVGGWKVRKSFSRSEFLEFLEF